MSRTPPGLIPAPGAPGAPGALGAPVPTDALYAVNRAAVQFWRAQFLASSVARGYFASRQWADPVAVAATYQIGFAPGPGARGPGLLGTLRRTGVPGVRADQLEAALEQAGLVTRGRTSGALRDFFVGRLMFPIPCNGTLDALGDPATRIAGFGGRFLPDAWPARTADGPAPPKYLNTPETPIFSKRALLYGWPWAQATVRKRRSLLVLEGYLDCLRVREAVGATDAVACCGTALGADHLRVVRRGSGRSPAPLTIYLMTDSDAAGRRAAERGARLALHAGFQARIVRFTGGKDPDELLRDGTEASRAAFADALTQAETPVMNYLDVVAEASGGAPAWPHDLRAYVTLLRDVQRRAAHSEPPGTGSPPGKAGRGSGGAAPVPWTQLIRSDAERLAARVRQEARLALSTAQALDLLSTAPRVAADPFQVTDPPPTPPTSSDAP